MKLFKHKQIIVAVLVAIVAGIGGAVAYGVFYSDLKNTTKDDVGRQQKQLGTIAAQEIERYFYDIQKRMETIALMPNVRDAQRSENCNMQLQKIVELNSKELNNLGRVSKDGTFVCAVNRAIVGEHVSKYGDYFEKIANDPQHNPAMSRLIIPTGSASSVVAIHVPVYDSSGQFNGTIGGAVYFDELQQRLLAGTQLSKNSVLAIYDDDYRVLYNPDPLIRGKYLTDPAVKQFYTPANALESFMEKIKQAPTEGTVEYSLRDIPRTVFYKSVPVVDRYWTVVMAVPLKDTQDLIGNKVAQALFVGMTILLVAIVTAATYSIFHIKTKKV